ncbi:MAG: hypothetical protein PF436_10445, partial [Prolixibacteraceae bacterium]|nr:hypothetical protein [Prolixibacteraceae bacterium]
GLFLLGILARKAKNIDAVAGVVIGVFVILWMSLSPIYFTGGVWLQIQSGFHTNFTIVVGTTVIFLVGFLLSKLAHKKNK